MFIKEIVIKTNDGVTKFKIRCPRFLYTASIKNAETVSKIKSIIPANVQKVELNNKGKKKVEKPAATGKKAPKK